MPVPLIGKKKFESNCIVTTKAFLEDRRRRNKHPDIRGAKSAVLYFDSNIQKYIEHNLPCTQIEHLKTTAYIVERNGKRIILRRCPIGAPGSVVIMEELVAMGVEKIISVGTAGSLQSGITPASIVLCNRAYRDEGTSYHYMQPSEYVDADPRLKRELREMLDSHKISHVSGATWTTDAPYRETAEDVIYFAEKNVFTVEMEASALIAAARVLQIQFTAIFVVSDLLTTEGWAPHFNNLDVGKNLNKLTEAAIDTLAG